MSAPTAPAATARAATIPGWQLPAGYYRVPASGPTFVDLQVDDRSSLARRPLDNLRRVIHVGDRRDLALITPIAPMVWEYTDTAAGAPAELLAQLLADPEGCSLRYHCETGRCAGCNLDLANHPDNQRAELHVNCVTPASPAALAGPGGGELA